MIKGHEIPNENFQPGMQRKELELRSEAESALDLLLGSDITVMSALSLPAVDSLRGESGIALTADHLIALVLSGESGERSFNLLSSHTTTSKSEDEMESGFLLNIVIRKSSAILELLTGEDKSLLIWRDTFFILNLSLDIFNGVSRLDVKSDCLSCKGLDKDLHTMNEIIFI